VPLEPWLIVLIALTVVAAIAGFGAILLLKDEEPRQPQRITTDYSRERELKESKDPREAAKWAAARRAQQLLHEKREREGQAQRETAERARQVEHERRERQAAQQQENDQRTHDHSSTPRPTPLADPSRREQERRWTSARTQFGDARARMAAYEIDPALAIDFPAFNDVAVPEVKAMVAALRRATNLADTSQAHSPIGGSRELLLEFEIAVVEFTGAIDTAERKARALRWSHLPELDRQDLDQIKALLAHAESPGNTDEARVTYYAQLQKVIRRLNDRAGHPVVPAGAVSQIEASARLSLS
jgi:hypothetical protein